MANLRDIRRRITSVQATQKITSAMKMVSAAKLRRARSAIDAARPYARLMREMLDEVTRSQPDAEHPLFEVREARRGFEVVVMTSDRGLAGAFNSAIIKRAEQLLAERESEFQNTFLTLVGKKACDHFKRRRARQVSHSRVIGSHVTYSESKEIAERLMRRFEAGEVDEVVLVHSEFVSTMTQRTTIAQLLPISAGVSAAGEERTAAAEDEALAFEIEPNPQKFFAALVPRAVETRVFHALLENQAGEHAARMTAMESATRNTEELIDRLTLEFNRARQATITSELVEIVTGAQALE